MIVWSLLAFSLPIVLLIFFIAFVLKNKEKGAEVVIRYLYTYLVLFATLMMLIGGGISIFMAVADLISPPSYYQSYSDYKQMRETGKAEGNPDISDNELIEEYNQLIKDETRRVQQDAKNQILKSLGFIVIPLPIFLYFTKMRKTQT